MKRNPVIVVAGLVAALSLAVTGCASGAPATSAPASTSAGRRAKTDGG